MILERGITALNLGLEIFKFREHDEILIPEIVCKDLLELFFIRKIIPVFYTLDDNLTPNWENLSRVISNSNNIKAILMIHFFGQPQDINKFIKFKEKYKLLLIEDNAHGHGGVYNNKLLGVYGDIGISSPRKMLDLNTVGILFLNNKNYELPNSSYNRAEISYFTSFARRLQFYFPKLRSFLLFVKNILSKSDELDTNLVSIKLADRYSEKIYLKTNWENIAIERRRNWEIWANYMQNFGFKPIFDLSVTSSPWAIPFYISSEDEYNRWLCWANKKGYIFFLWPNYIFSNKTRQIMCIRLDIKPQF